jgi:hypothetical protein
MADSVRRKLLIAICICVALAIGFAAGYWATPIQKILKEPEPPGAFSDWKTFRNNDLAFGCDFELQYPPFWAVEVDRAPAADNFSFIGETGTWEFLVQVLRSGNITAEAFAEIYYPHVANLRVEPLVFNGYSAAKIAPGQGITGSIFVVRNGCAFVLPDLDAGTKLMQDIGTTFRVDNLPAAGAIPATSTPATITVDAEEQFGYIKSIYQQNGKWYLDIDYAVFFADSAADIEAASRAALADGKCGSFNAYNCAPGGFYIRNTNSQIRTFEVSPSARVVMAQWSHEADGNFKADDLSLDFTGFAGIFSGKTVLTPEGGSASGFMGLPYWIVMDNGVVTEIRQQYIP